MANEIPTETIHVLARSIFKESLNYGFGTVDVIRLVNELMDLCVTDSKAGTGSHTGPAAIPVDDIQSADSFPLISKRLKIRKYSPENDAKLLEQWLPEKYGRYFVLSSTTAQTITIETLTTAPGNHLGIITTPDDEPIGAVAYLDHNKLQKRAELRKLVGDVASRGQGLAEEATRLWIRYGLESLGLEKIYVSTLQTHISNIALNENIGFKVEGLLRNEILIDGQRHDVLRMGICKE